MKEDGEEQEEEKKVLIIIIERNCAHSRETLKLLHTAMVSTPLTQHFYRFSGITVPIKIKAYVQLTVRIHFVGVILLVFTIISTTVYHHWCVIIDYFSRLSSMVHWLANLLHVIWLAGFISNLKKLVFI